MPSLFGTAERSKKNGRYWYSESVKITENRMRKLKK